MVKRIRLSIEFVMMRRTDMRQLKSKAGIGLTFSVPIKENNLGKWF